MRMTVFGASGKVGRLVVQEALRRGHQVVAFVHSAQLEPAEGLTIVKGDIHDASAVAAAIQGSQAVLSSLGSWGTASQDILAAAMSNVIPAMEQGPAKRLVSLTGNIARRPDERLGLVGDSLHAAMSLAAGKVLADGEKHLALLQASQLDWTAVRSPVMTGQLSTTYHLSQRFSLTALVSRRAVANCLLDLAESKQWSRQAPFISN